MHRQGADDEVERAVPEWQRRDVADDE
jgi:hypothetical protein